MSNLLKNEEYRSMIFIKKGVSGGVTASIALFIVSCFGGLSPEQQQAGVVVGVSVLEILRNVLKCKFPKIFSFF
jgi:hypothetical protein